LSVGEFVILEIKRMSDVTDQYVTRVRKTVVVQYVSIKSTLERTLGPQGWSVNQRIVMSGPRSLNDQDLHNNQSYFKVSQTGIKSIRSKLAFKVFDEYGNILKGTHSMRFNDRPTDSDSYDQTDSVPYGSMFPLSQV
jgi:hypothetical protein